MHTKREQEAGVISMCLIGGLFIVGVLTGGNKLSDPRVVTLFEEPKVDPTTGKAVMGVDGRQVTIPKMRMSPMPGNPPYVISNRMSLVYPIPEHDKNTLDLYKRVTAPPPNLSEARLVQ